MSNLHIGAGRVYKSKRAPDNLELLLYMYLSVALYLRDDSEQLVDHVGSRLCRLSWVHAAAELGSPL
jgi:hypothetical protein